MSWKPTAVFAQYKDVFDQTIEYCSFPAMGHNMHEQDPEGFAKILIKWESTLPD